MDAPTPSSATPTPKPDPLQNGTYIRTFAKDVEKLTGKHIEPGKPVVPKRELSQPKAPKTLEEQITPDAESMATPAYRSALAEPEKAISLDGARSEILTRLKSAAKNAMPPTQPKAAPIERPAFTPPPPPPRPTPAPARSQDDLLSPLHTFKTDFSGKMGRERASKIAVLAAEGDAPRLKQRTERPSVSVKTVAIGVGVILLIGGGAGIFFALKFRTATPQVPTVHGVPSLVFADSTKEIMGTGTELMRELNAAAETPLPDKNVLVTYVTDASATTSPADRIPLPGGSLIEALRLQAPTIILRNIEDASTVGVIRAGSETRPFFILRVTSYERTFAGMLAWEETMPQQLRILYPAYQSSPFVSNTASTTAATSTIPKSQTVVVPKETAPAGFVDEVASNHDVRILYDAQHRAILLYGYRDKNTLIIARDRAAFAALVDRLSSAP